MDPLLLHPTSTAQWHALVNEAKSASGIQVDEDLESYLVFLLMRFVSEAEVATHPLALDYLQSYHLLGSERREQLQQVGDKCLLFAGLFPELAEQRLVQVSYFVDLGQNSYGMLSDLWQRDLARLFNDLREGFVPLMDVLQSMRCLSDRASQLTPLQADELWRTTGSQRAFDILRQYCDGLPGDLNDEDNRHRH